MTPFSPYQLTPKISLCWPELTYAKALFKIIDHQRQYLNTWLTWVNQICTIEDTKRFLYEARLFNEGGQKLITFIFYQNQLVGSVALVKIDKLNRTGEIGYWLHQDFQRKGITTLACRKLIDLAFNQLLLHRLIIRINHANHKSSAIAHRLGFQLEGILREATFINGKFQNTKLFSLLEKDLV